MVMSLKNNINIILIEKWVVGFTEAVFSRMHCRGGIKRSKAVDYHPVNALIL
jgi:hypothetical protein